MRIGKHEVVDVHKIENQFKKIYTQERTIRLWQSSLETNERNEIRTQIVAFDEKQRMVKLKVLSPHFSFNLNEVVFGLVPSEKLIFKTHIRMQYNKAVVIELPQSMIDIRENVFLNEIKQNHLRLIHAGDEVLAESRKILSDELRQYERKETQFIDQSLLWISSLDPQLVNDIFIGHLLDLSANGASIAVKGLKSFMKKNSFILFGGIHHPLKIRAKIRYIVPLNKKEGTYRIGIKFYSMTKGEVFGNLSK